MVRSRFRALFPTAFNARSNLMPVAKISTLHPRWAEFVESQPDETIYQHPLWIDTI
ncbi:MAG: hypothetical protein JO041_00440 [Acidobacteria bacterium]|nr:hypothetical protein [Acidobacteriota bacterium]